MRLIDADALDAEMYHKSFEVDDGRNVWNSGLWIRYKIFEEAIIDTPTVDAVPVIRCKDCKFSMSGIDKYNERYILCQLHERSYGVIDDGFCAWAERKTDETD